jgi:hypothetical protein
MMSKAKSIGNFLCFARVLLQFGACRICGTISEIVWQTDKVNLFCGK